MPGSGGGQASRGDRGATPLFPTFFRSFLGLAGGRAALEPARCWVWRGSSGSKRRAQVTRPARDPSSEWARDCICRWYGEVEAQTRVLLEFFFFFLKHCRDPYYMDQGDLPPFPPLNFSQGRPIKTNLKTLLKHCH